MAAIGPRGCNRFYYGKSNTIEKQGSLIKSKIGESNPVGNGYQHGTTDANDRASVGYLMQQWAG